jgi:hypothetical protein
MATPVKIESIKDAYRLLAQQTKEVFAAMGTETITTPTTEDETTKPVTPQPEEEKVTVGSLLQYLHVATDQTDSLVNELLMSFKGVDYSTKQKEGIPVNILDKCVNLADKIITLRNKIQELKDTVS